ncbi:hypothetical protein [Candidatus Pelagibacter sp. Uisw_127]|uniref:hypothetical protein n=1 Tax=Candidatus Pelagibacter sp. Uisw_127 TaxID=3230988 RepID=UPI0039E84022
MILKKIVIGLFFGCFLNGCAGGSAFLGPVYTLANTGSVYHAGLSYGSGKVVKKIIEKTPTENIKSSTSNKKNVIEKKEESYDEFFVLVKSQIEKKSKILNLANQ